MRESRIATVMKEVSDNDGNEEEDHDAVDGDDDGCPEDHGGT